MRSLSRTALVALLVALMVGAGVMHFLAPHAFAQIVPPALGPPRPWVFASGAAEILSGLALGAPRTRRAGAWGVAAVLVAVFPANVYMALRGGIPGAGWPFDSALLSWLRLPVQVLLVAWALSLRHEQQPSRAG